MPSRGFWRFALRRLLAAVLLMLGVTLVAFVLTNLVPADPVSAALGDRAAADPDVVAAFRARHGLDQPLPVQYLTYLSNLLQGDMGVSQQTRRPVLDDLREFIPATLELAFFALGIAIVLGVTLGTLAAMHRNRWIDQVLRVFTLTGVSVPLFWLALVAFYLLSFRLGLFPGIGRLDPGMPRPPNVTGMYTIDSALSGDWVTFRSAVGHVLLPSLVLAAYTVSLLTRFTRSAVLDVLGNDYVRTARAKGLPGRVVITRHVLRAALVPIVTVAGVIFGSVLSGTVLVEAIFAWPGIGQYAFRAATNLDLPAIMGVALFVGFIYVTINFVVDVLYGTIDPRIRLE